MTTPSRRITVFIVDDSAVSRDLLTRVLSSDPEITVIGSARSGAEAVTVLTEAKPNVVTMDIHMPGIDGFEATRQIMESQPVPIVIVSASFDHGDVAKAFRAMEAGAVAAVEKPSGPGSPKYETLSQKLIETVKTMSEVRVVRRWSRTRMEPRVAEPVAVPRAAEEIRLVAIAASTGGPPVLQTLLTRLPKPCPVPVFIVQHISAGFVEGLADWLSTTTGMTVRLARHGELAQPGIAYVAQDRCQMSVGKDLRMVCGPEAAEHGLRPSASFLFRSIAETIGAAAAGVLLTGMGRDGAEELKRMRDAGAVTFAQDQESSVVHGMPGEAIRLGAAMHVGNPERIAATLHAMLAPRVVSP
ncbi:MAG TPA: chemotaxis-specific protein-glutamate methyltransferase CheB [Chthoniobacteraceae bacterium]|nr:chemotaxis-specific protein-glutamate methyltransferase CheB [Chthoniobacteraceae bacterium]